MLPAQMIKPRQILAQFIGENFGLAPGGGGQFSLECGCGKINKAY
jgi:hypothetical protein